MKKYIPYVTIIAVITIIFGTIYTIGQQSIRLSANMPQIQIAEDTALDLNDGAQPSFVLPPSKKVDIDESSASFIIIYDKAGKAVAGSGEIDDKLPVIPFGVLQSTPRTGYHAVTWAPKSGVRIASVEVQANDYYILVGRSLDEPEKLVETIGKLTLLGYFLTLLTVAAGVIIWNVTKKQ
jgi:hypothetical protein